MTKELFNIVLDCFKSIPIDSWEIDYEGSGLNFFWIKYDYVLLNSKGEVKVNKHWQSVSWLQCRKLKRFVREIKEEVAARALQRLCDRA